MTEYLQRFVHQVIEHITHFFKPRQRPEFTVAREPFSTPPAPAATPVVKQRKKRDYTVKQNLADLLDNLDLTFDVMKMPTDKLSWLNKDTVRGLKRLGVYVPDNPWDNPPLIEPDAIRIDLNKTLPAMMAISFCLKDHTHPDKPDLVFPNTMFAIKHRKLPTPYTQIPGVPYEFGFSYNFARTHNFWIQCFVVIDTETGGIRMCDELRAEQVTIPVKHGRKNHGATRQYMKTQWREPLLVKEDEHWTRGQRQSFVLNSFVKMLNWWNERNLRWSVGVRKKRDRVVFSVEPQNTKIYFADRDKSVKTANGHTKKIIHYVRAHERVTATKTVTVREHIRGLREFDWGPHHCIVTAPQFHRTHLSSEFDVPADDPDARPSAPMVTASDFGKLLADHEEMDRRKSA